MTTGLREARGRGGAGLPVAGEPDGKSLRPAGANRLPGKHLGHHVGMPRLPTARRLALAVGPLALLAAAVGLPADPLSAATASYELRMGFDSGETLATGSRVFDTSGQRHGGTVLSGSGGALSAVKGWHATTSARFPTPCAAQPCKKSIIEVPSAPGLDLEYAPMEWGARLLLGATSTSSGQNLVQKGLYADPSGQWKLQVDGGEGKPSCVVSGSRRDGSSGRVIVSSGVTVTTGTWHKVSCRRTGRGVAIVVDGRQRGYQDMRPVRLTGNAPVRIGGKWVDREGNDQFHGLLDDVYVLRR